MSPRWVIGLIAIFAICTIICNTLDQQDVYTGSDMQIIGNLTTQHSLGGATDSTGSPFSFINSAVDFFKNLWKIMVFDYSFFKNPDGSANEWAIVRYIVFWPLTIGMIFTLALYLRQITVGT